MAKTPAKKTQKTGSRIARKPAARKAGVPANAMYYPQHEETYELFLWLSKWTIAGCVALLLALSVMFPLGAGFIAGVLVFVISLAVAKFVL